MSKAKPINGGKQDLQGLFAGGAEQLACRTVPRSQLPVRIPIAEG